MSCRRCRTLKWHQPLTQCATPLPSGRHQLWLPAVGFAFLNNHRWVPTWSFCLLWALHVCYRWSVSLSHSLHYLRRSRKIQIRNIPPHLQWEVSVCERVCEIVVLCSRTTAHKLANESPACTLQTCVCRLYLRLCFYACVCVCGGGPNLQPCFSVLHQLSPSTIIKV